MAFVRVRRPVLACAAILAGALVAHSAQAVEGGASVYLLGTGGPGAAVLPPIEGLFLLNTAYHYDGKGGGDKQFLLGGNLVAGIKGNINADFATALFVPSTDIAGGTLAVGLALPVGDVAVDVNAVITGPRGNAIGITASDNKLIVGDPILVASLGWTTGKTHIAASTMVNVPIGDYRKDQLANLAFHRWALDTSLAVTWLDPKAGWDISGKAGVTFNSANHWTDYNSGNEFHVEGSIEKIFSPAWSAGIQAYYYDQISADKGRGAELGPFEGQVTGLGAQGAYNFKIAGKIPATLRLHAFKEFDAKNRMEGQSVFLDFSMPLWVKLPPGAPAP